MHHSFLTLAITTKHIQQPAVSIHDIPFTTEYFLLVVADISVYPEVLT